MTNLDLKAARKTLNYTQAQLAKAIGVSTGTVARWEGANNPGTPKYVDVAIGCWLALKQEDRP